MPNDLNACSFIGRLGDDPTTRYTAAGAPIVSISIACGWKSKDKEGTEWIPVTAFGKLAEIMAQYLRKGSQVYIQGRYTTDKYEKDGQTRYSTKVVADRMQMLGGTDNRGENRGAQNRSSTPETPGDDFTDDIPF